MWPKRRYPPSVLLFLVRACSRVKPSAIAMMLFKHRHDESEDDYGCCDGSQSESGFGGCDGWSGRIGEKSGDGRRRSYVHRARKRQQR